MRLVVSYIPIHIQVDSSPDCKCTCFQVDFVKMLLSFNKDAMENCTMEKLKPYMENPLFKPEKVRRISVACRSICIWIRAMYNYHYAKTVKMEPRIEKLKVRIPVSVSSSLSRVMTQLGHDEIPWVSF